MMSAGDAFTTWFTERAKAIHGVDLTAPMTGSPSELVVDTAHVPVLAREPKTASPARTRGGAGGAGGAGVT
jgi:hypothetical protein